MAAGAMLKESLDDICKYACGSIKADLNRQEFGWLLRPREHVTLLALRRTAIIVTRVRLIAGLFAVLTPLWLLVDVSVFPFEIWRGLAAARIAAMLAFAIILVYPRRMVSLADAHQAMWLLLGIPTVFFVFSYQHMAQFNLDGIPAAFKAGYAFLPFVMVAGLSMFPLTVLECLLFATPMLVAQLAVTLLNAQGVAWPMMAATLWLLILITAVTILSGISQLAFMVVLVRDAIRDRMTGCFSRSSGEELLDLQFILANRIKAPLTVAFVDLDHFKQVNDRFGHEAGDQVLATAAERIRNCLRTGDILIRWGGEEFVVVMPNVDAQQACHALNRLRREGLGRRPDRAPTTASIGVAERIADGADSWKHLVERADARMYEGKQAGRDRIVGCP